MTSALLCPRCSAAVEQHQTGCPSCGAKLTRCVSCRELLLASDRFCVACGARQNGPPGQGGEPGPRIASSWDAVLARLRQATLGEYDIAGEIGRGGMAAVYLAHDIALNRKVAIKVMAPELMLGPGMVERFRQEAQTIARLRHPHVVTVHAIREAEGLHFLVMQYVEGQSLEALLARSGPLPIDVALEVLSQIGSALGYAHRQGVIHRDVKPGNVLVDAEGDAWVADFGIAKVAEAANLTSPGEPIGTPAYMSPEQCEGQPATAASDQYAFGVLAYELLTGERPFAGVPLAVMRAHVESSPPPIGPRRPDCPAGVERTVLRMLAKKPAARFPSVNDALAALGGRAVGGSEAVREQIRDRVAAGAGAGPATPRTPMSPIPGESSDPAAAVQATVRTGSTVAPRTWRRLRWLALPGIAVGLLLWVALREDGTGSGPTAASEVVDLPPGADLAAALAEAVAGGEIRLGAGEYRVDRTLDLTASIRLVGRGPDSTRLVGPPDAVTLMVAASASGAEVSGIEIVHQARVAGAPPAIRILAPAARVIDVRVVGVGLLDAANCGVVGAGVLIGGSSAAEVSGSELRGFCSGIQVADSAAPALIRNLFTANHAAIRYFGVNGGQAIGNTIRGNRDGVVIVAGSPILDGNEISDSRGFGIAYLEGSRPDLRNNRLSNNLGGDIDRP